MHQPRCESAGVPYIGDLRIDLITPAGTSIVLHNNSGGSRDNIRRNYSSLNLPALRTLDRTAAAGTWRLRLVDTARRDVGTLNSWRLTARLAATPTPAARPDATNNGESSADHGSPAVACVATTDGDR